MTDNQIAILKRFVLTTALAVAVAVVAALINFLQGNSLGLPDFQQQLVVLILIPVLGTLEAWLVSLQAVQTFTARLRR